MKYFTFPLSGMRKVAYSPGIGILGQYISDPKQGATDLANFNRSLKDFGDKTNRAMFGDTWLTRSWERTNAAAADNFDDLVRGFGGTPRGAAAMNKKPKLPTGLLPTGAPPSRSSLPPAYRYELDRARAGEEFQKTGVIPKGHIRTPGGKFVSQGVYDSAEEDAKRRGLVIDWGGGIPK